MERPSLLGRLNDGRELPIQPCNCGHCNNEWFMAALSREWMPSYCPYCGIKFLRKTIGEGDDEEPDDYLPAKGLAECDEGDCCPRCEGSGEVTTADYESYLGENYKACPMCGGSGHKKR